MQVPRVSWQILEDIGDKNYEFNVYKNYTEEDSLTPGKTLKKSIRVWNNYLGAEDVQDIKNATLVLGFKTYEDNFLLNLIRVSINGSEFKELDLSLNGGTIFLGDLSGTSNNGREANYTNYKNIEIEIGPMPDNMRSELKSLYFYLEYKIEEESDEDFE